VESRPYRSLPGCGPRGNSGCGSESTGENPPEFAWENEEPVCSDPGGLRGPGFPPFGLGRSGVLPCRIEDLEAVGIQLEILDGPVGHHFQAVDSIHPIRTEIQMNVQVLEPNGSSPKLSRRYRYSTRLSSFHWISLNSRWSDNGDRDDAGTH